MGLYHTPGRVGSYGWGLVAAWVASGFGSCAALGSSGFYFLLVSYRPLAAARFSFESSLCSSLSAFLGRPSLELTTCTTALLRPRSDRRRAHSRPRLAPYAPRAAFADYINDSRAAPRRFTPPSSVVPDDAYRT